MRPLALDLDRDGFVDDIGYFRDTNHTWHYSIDHEGTVYVGGDAWGAPGDLPIAGNFETK